MLTNILLQTKLKFIFVWTALILLICSASVYFLGASVFEEKLGTTASNSLLTNGDTPILLWWTPFTGEEGSVKICNKNNLQASCFLTNDRTYATHTNTKALLFYGSSFSPWELPPHRPTRPLWALLHEESPRNSALLQHEIALSLFNFSATFSRYSDFSLTLQHLNSLEDLIGHEFLVPWELKNKYQKDLELAPVVYIQSDCDTATDRDNYVKELMKYIKVDSYGACLKNKQLPDSINDSMSSLHEDEFWKFQAQYKFSIAFENGECNDYITEKLWRPLVIGSVPIYFGSATFKDWLPYENSAIDVRDFSSPKELAEHISDVGSDEKKYMKHLKHKTSASSELNSALVNRLKTRTWNVGRNLWNNFAAKTLVEEYECFLCRKIFSKLEEGKNIVNQKHYDCPVPSSPLTKSEMTHSFWHDQWHQGKFEGEVLQELLLSKSANVTQDEFYQLVGMKMSSVINKK